MAPGKKETGVIKSKMIDTGQDNVFYMTFPVNNYFLEKSKSQSRENTFYTFSIQSNQKEASFVVHASGTMVKELINMSESYIKPACEETNMPTSNTRNIITTRPGIALLEGDKWIIKTKAAIRYE